MPRRMCAQSAAASGDEQVIATGPSGPVIASGTFGVPR